MKLLLLCESRTKRLNRTADKHTLLPLTIICTALAMFKLTLIFGQQVANGNRNVVTNTTAIANNEKKIMHDDNDGGNGSHTHTIISISNYKK